MDGNSTSRASRGINDFVNFVTAADRSQLTGPPLRMALDHRPGCSHMVFIAGSLALTGPFAQVIEHVLEMAYSNLDTNNPSTFHILPAD